MTELPPTAQAPVCYRHPSRETYVRCTRCDRPICPDCMNEASVGHQCPECVAQGRKEQRPVLTVFGGSTAGAHGYVTITLIVINAIVLVLSFLSVKGGVSALGGGGMGGLLGSGTPLSQKLAVIGETYDHYSRTGQLAPSPAGVATGQYYRLFTAMFMHYGLLHIATNMYMLWVIGRPLEAMFGPFRFLAIYIVCGLGGNVAVYLFAPDTASAGASTALFGLLGVFFFVLRKLNRSTAGLVPVVVINLVITLTVPNISIAGHIGGLLTGLAIGAGITAAPRERRTIVQVAVLVGAIVVLGLATAWQTHHLNHLTA